jgi:hypothetical protein
LQLLELRTLTVDYLLNETPASIPPLRIFIPIPSKLIFFAKGESAFPYYFDSIDGSIRTGKLINPLYASEYGSSRKGHSLPMSFIFEYGNLIRNVVSSTPAFVNGPRQNHVYD